MIRPPRPLAAPLALTAVLALCACGQDAVSTTKPARSAQPRAHLVETAVVAQDSRRLTSVHTGSLRARRSMRVFTQEEGRVTELPFYEGDAVERGSVLLRLDDALLAAELDKAVATRRQTEIDLERVSRLRRSQAVAEEEIARARTAVEVARAEERMLRTRVGYTTVRAPFASLVSARLVEPGDVVARHAHVLSLTDPTSLVTDLAVSELLLPHLAVGDPVTVRVDALGDARLAGAILRIHPELDPRTRHGRVEVELDPVPANARAGQFARVTFTAAALSARVVPFSAVRRDREGEFVFRLDEQNRAHRVPIRSGRRFADRVEVLDGLEDGQVVVAKGFLGLTEGMQVKPAGEAAGQQGS